MSNPLNVSSGLLATLRRELVERLQAASDFTEPVSIPVIDGGRTDFPSAVDKALAARTGGLCLVVTCPKVEASTEPRSIEVTISIQIYEHPVLNWGPKGAQRSPEDTGESIMALLLFNGLEEGWSPSATWTSLQFSGLRPVFASTEQVVFEITFTTRTVIRITE